MLVSSLAQCTVNWADISVEWDPWLKLSPVTRGLCVWYRYSVHQRAERWSEDLTQRSAV